MLGELSSVHAHLDPAHGALKIHPTSQPEPRGSFLSSTFQRSLRCADQRPIGASDERSMSTHSESIFSNVRPKKRRTRSNVLPTTSTYGQHGETNWDNVPAAYRPVERTEVRGVDGSYLNRPLPGAPPRPHTTSPHPALDAQVSLDFGNLRKPTPRTHRTRSAEIAQRGWSNLDDIETEARKRASVNIANALLPAHLDPPPPYSEYSDASSFSHEPRPRSQFQPTRTSSSGRPDDPNDYVEYQNQNIRRPSNFGPVIATPQPPTPISPLNTLDLQHLTIRRQPALANNVTIDSLLGYPMLGHR